MTSIVTPKPEVDCHGLTQPVAWLYAVATPSNALLFLLRVRGVFMDSPKTVWFFGVLWLSTCLSITFPISVMYMEDISVIRKVCTASHAGVYGLSGFVTVLVFDTCVFLATSYKVLSINMAGTWRKRYRVCLKGETLGSVSRLLIRSGLIYYL